MGALGHGGALRTLFLSFLVPQAARLSPLRLALLAVSVARAQGSAAESLDFLSQAFAGALALDDAGKTAPAVADKDRRAALEGLVVVRAEAGRLMVRLARAEEAKALLASVQAATESMPGADPAVLAGYHGLAAEFYQAKGNHIEFYRNGLLFLAHSRPGSIPEAELAHVGLSLGLSALVGDGIFNFGELLNNPIIGRLALQHPWLSALLLAFNNGDLPAYHAIVAREAAAIAQHPVLVANQAKLREKISIMTLLAILFRRAPHDRTLPFAEIAASTGLTEKEVEMMLMRALSLNLIRGDIDEVDRKVRVTWILPRVLGKDDLQGFIAQIDDWNKRANETLGFMTAETPELFVAGN